MCDTYIYTSCNYKPRGSREFDSWVPADFHPVGKPQTAQKSGDSKAHQLMFILKCPTPMEPSTNM